MNSGLTFIRCPEIELVVIADDGLSLLDVQHLASTFAKSTFKAHIKQNVTVQLVVEFFPLVAKKKKKKRRRKQINAALKSRPSSFCTLDFVLNYLRMHRGGFSACAYLYPKAVISQFKAALTNAFL